MITCDGLYSRWTADIPPVREQFRTVKKHGRSKIMIPVIVDRTSHPKLELYVDGNLVETLSLSINSSRINKPYLVYIEYPKNAVYRTDGIHELMLVGKVYADVESRHLMYEKVLIEGWKVKI